MIDYLPSERAWVTREWADGRTQEAIARDLGLSSGAICMCIKKFTDAWAGVDVEKMRAYGEERRSYAQAALRNYVGDIRRPDRPVDFYKSLGLARLEHAWLLRLEGLKLHEIAARIGVTRERVRQMICAFSRKVKWATRNTRVTVR